MQAAKTADGALHVMGATGSTTYESLDLTGIHYDSSTGAFTDRRGVQYPGAGSSYPYVLREDPSGNEITTPGPGATVDTLGRTTTTGTAAACPTEGGLLPVSSTSTLSLPGPASAGGSTVLTICAATVTLSTNFYDADTQYNGTASYLQSVVLPDGTAWSFLYDNYGDITKILFPLGASLSYSWATISGNAYDSQAVASRTLDANDGTGGHTWNYTWLYNAPGGVTVTDPLGNDAVYTSTSYNGSFYVTQAQYYQGSHLGGNVLKTVATNYGTSPTVPYLNCGGGVNSVFSVHPTSVTTTMGGMVSQVQTDYDSGFNFTSPNSSWPGPYAASFGDVTARREYDWGSGSPGALLRQTVTSYLALSNSSYQTNNLLDLPTSVVVYDGSGATQAATNYGYDATTPVASGITTQHDANPPDAPYRGNQTSVSRWLNTSGTYLTTANTFFDTGMLDTSADPANNTTTYTYSPNFVGAYLTSVQDPMGHVTGYNYDFNTGLRASVTDVNNQTTSFTFDSLWRPSQITYPAVGGSATFSYVDSTSPSMTLSRTVGNGVNYVETAYTDGIGRVKQMQLTSDPDGTTNVVTTYDADGRKYAVTNPYRSTSDPTYGVTSFGYDALGRVTTVYSPSGGNVTTSYTANCTTVADQQGKQRESCTDGLGRMTQVFEPDPASGSLVNETDYAYDALDNLIQVQQKGNDPNSGDWRTRTFAYDSFSRLLSASNPESGTTTYAYNYGADHLLSSKQDGRGIFTYFNSYDGDLRLLSKSYSDSTPAVSYAFDGGGCLGQPSCSNIHHRTSLSDGAGSEAWAYDAMGRGIVDQRTSNGLAKSFIYGYTNNGSVNSITYPSGHAITYDIRGALRPDWAQDTGSGINYATGLAYWPQGAVSTAAYGGVISRSDSYNNRLQPSSLTATVGGTAALSLSYNFADGSGHNNGNVMGITNNLDATRSFTFSYDQLNRISTAATSSGSAAYSEDIWGNLYSISLTGSPAWQNGLSLGILTNNRISGDGYDNAGNMTSDGLYSYTYDAEERQSSAAGATYRYDGDGKRVEKANSEIYWYGLGSEPLLETDWSGNLQNEYVFLGGSRIARRDSGNNVYYYFGDHLGTSRVIADTYGNKCYDADFGPYGKEAVYTNACAQNYKFTGKERDAETGNDYFGARFDESNMGRFMSPDPKTLSPKLLVNPQRWNKYPYSINNPPGAAGCWIGFVCRPRFTTSPSTGSGSGGFVPSTSTAGRKCWRS